MNLFEDLGENGYSYNNRFGSWYTHSIYRPTGLNFLAALTRNKFYELSGFDERFRNGTGFDDDEFRDRLLESGTIFNYIDNAIGVHINHEIVNNLPPTTNQDLYNITRIDKYLKNELWGRR
jgi:hypothetical protein